MEQNGMRAQLQLGGRLTLSPPGWFMLKYAPPTKYNCNHNRGSKAKMVGIADGG